MTSLAETIDTALAAIGSETEHRLRDVIGDFEALNLVDEERVAALATAIAAIAATYHPRHVGAYLEAIRSWSTEVAQGREFSAPRLRYIPDIVPIERGAQRLSRGLDTLIDDMRRRGLDIRDRLITELAVMARLLGRHDANTISVALIAIARALADPAYRRGSAVMVPVRDVTPAAQTSTLAIETPRGAA